MTKLLIVDDSSMMRRSIENTLTELGIQEIKKAKNGEIAVDQIKSFKPDIVTLDITMPKMDGLQCLDEIMAIAPETKVVVITALSDKLTGLQALDKGAEDYLFKPVKSQDLKRVFNEILATSNEQI